MIDIDALPMRIALGQFNELTDEQLLFVKQCGCDDVLLNTPKLPGDERWEYDDLLAWRTGLFRGAAHHYEQQRRIVDAVPQETLPLGPDDVRARLGEWRTLVATSA